MSRRQSSLNMHSPDSVLASDEHLYQVPAYAKLLPELLLALLGHTGDVFIEKSLFLPGRPGEEVSPDRCNFAVTDAPGLVSLSERSATLLSVYTEFCPQL